jgi:hypothetical protein
VIDQVRTLLRQPEVVIGTWRAAQGEETRRANREPTIAEGEPGFYLQFAIEASQVGAVESLEDKRKAIELVAVRPPADGETMVSATVFVPDRSAEFLSQKIEAYRDEVTRYGRPKNEALVARIENVELGALRALFTDDLALYPLAGQQSWWEVWIRDGRLDAFRRLAGRLTVPVKQHSIAFPERDVVLAYADEQSMVRLVENSDAVAELRIAKDTPAIFLQMPPIDQADWASDLVDRVVAPPSTAPAVCILDSGATRAHPLIRPGLKSVDQHAYDNAWGVGDSATWNGHGTMMAGVALYGDLEAALTDGGSVTGDVNFGGRLGDQEIRTRRRQLVH